MKSIFNLSKGILSVALISVAFASCSEDTMDRINEDKDPQPVYLPNSSWLT